MTATAGAEGPGGRPVPDATASSGDVPSLLQPAAAHRSGALALTIDAVLPQTQCTRCGFLDCADYAAAIAEDGVAIDRCPPGGRDGVIRLAAITGMPMRDVVDPVYGVEGPLRLAEIDEAACIGCRLCLKACPVDAILGGPKAMHTVVATDCTGCELCLPACPVDCIRMLPAGPGAPIGGSAWSPAQAAVARSRYHRHRARLARPAAPRAGRSGKRESTLASPASPSASPTTPPAAPQPSDARRLLELALARARPRATPTGTEPS